MRLFTKIRRTGLVTEALPEAAPGVVEIAREIEASSRALFGRAVAIRHVDAGSCNGCEMEIVGLPGPVYDMERFGLHFVASPRHADLLLVTGPVTRNMAVRAAEDLGSHARSQTRGRHRRVRAHVRGVRRQLCGGRPGRQHHSRGRVRGRLSARACGHPARHSGRARTARRDGGPALMGGSFFLLMAAAFLAGTAAAAAWPTGAGARRLSMLAALRRIDLPRSRPRGRSCCPVRRGRCAPRRCSRRSAGSRCRSIGSARSSSR